ncbi:protein canopy 4 [Lepeophtheirus salmonis]|uniref:protein canopy 4 n=1 Tax=Lepeophtheirus salmonis TaxID=72036 RepID=UPI001AEB172E|nr:protein canopy 4-like [Lepeophtheirus salmonis]
MRVPLICIIGLLSLVHCDQFDEEQYGVKYANDCEVCKIVSNEFTEYLSESASKFETLETGYSVEKKRKKTKYIKSELRLIETMEGLCERLMKYNIHKERTDWTRFARGTSQTFQALEGLVAKGVKVDLGIPYELWKNPSAEISNLKTQCESLVEKHDEDIEDWYFKHQENASLESYLCEKRFLKSKDRSCLKIALNKKGDDGKTEL